MSRQCRYEYNEETHKWRHIIYYENGRQKESQTLSEDGSEIIHESWFDGGQQESYKAYSGNKLMRSTVWWVSGTIQRKATRTDDGFIEQAWHLNGSKHYDNSVSNGQMHVILYNNNEKSEEYEISPLNKRKQLYYLDKHGRNAVLPEGDIIVWKACKTQNINVYVKLLVHANAKRLTAVSSTKARVEYAQVLEITDADNNQYTECESYLYKPIKYIVGQITYSDKFNDDASQTSSNGIHVHLYKDECDQWFSQ